MKRPGQRTKATPTTTGTRRAPGGHQGDPRPDSAGLRSIALGGLFIIAPVLFPDAMGQDPKTLSLIWGITFLLIGMVQLHREPTE